MDTVTWRELLSEATERLRSSAEAEQGSAASDARRIVEEASGAYAAELALVLGDPVTKGQMARFDSMLERRRGGEPLQYVLGHWGFRGLDLMVDQRVLIPRPETETVVEVALAELDRLGGREVATTVVDLGTGSGAIALAVATERVRTRVVATDASEEAAAVARANLAGIGRAAARVEVHTGSWYEALPGELRASIQLIVTNPPYVSLGADLPPAVADWEPRRALLAGPDGLEDIRLILEGAPEWLEADGALVCEFSPEQVSAVAQLASEHFRDVHTETDLTGRARVLVARGPVHP